jgi:hypothetical protein
MRIETKKSRGGNHGGGTTVKTVVLTDQAAAYVKRKATINGPRYRKEEANSTASTIIEAAERSIYITEDMIAAVAYLQEARGMCFSEQAQRGLDQLIAALWTAKA